MNDLKSFDFYKHNSSYVLLDTPKKKLLRMLCTILLLQSNRFLPFFSKTKKKKPYSDMQCDNHLTLGSKSEKLRSFFFHNNHTK